jgi:hypothetical protein
VKGEDGSVTIAAIAEGDKERDEQALALIGLHVKDMHLHVIKKAASAAAAWMYFKQLYTAQTLARKVDLRKVLKSG